MYEQLQEELKKFWMEQKIEYVYKYKGVIKEYSEDLTNHVLFLDVTNGRVFPKLKDLASYDRDLNIGPGSAKVRVEDL